MAILLPIPKITATNAAVTGQYASSWLSVIPHWCSNCWMEAQMIFIWKLFKSVKNRDFSRSILMKCAFGCYLRGLGSSLVYNGSLTGLRGEQRRSGLPEQTICLSVSVQANWGITMWAAGHSKDNRASKTKPELFCKWTEDGGSLQLLRDDEPGSLRVDWGITGGQVLRSWESEYFEWYW